MNDQADKLRQIIDNLKQKNSINRQDPAKNPEDVIEKKHARIITVTSGKGGVGKTNITTNLALALSEMGKRVIIFDADFGLSNVDLLFGIVPQFSLADVINNGKSILSILTQGPRGVRFISGGSGMEELIKLEKSQVESFVENMGLLDSIADFILVDTGAGLSDNVMSFVLAADDILLIITPEPTSITDAYALIKMVTNRDRNKNIKIVINRAESIKEGNDILKKMALVAEKFLSIKLDPLGFLLQDEAVKKAVKTQQPFYLAFPKSQVTKYIKDISVKLIESNATVHEPAAAGVKGFVGRLVGFLSN